MYVNYIRILDIFIMSVIIFTDISEKFHIYVREGL